MLVGALLMSAAACSAEPELLAADGNETSTTVVRAVTTTTAAPIPTIRSVAIVGDSLTVAATEELTLELASLGLEIVEIDAAVGRRIAANSNGAGVQGGLEAVETLVRAEQPDLWVIALGTNDAGGFANVDVGAEQVELLVEELPRDVPLVWVNTHIRGREGESGTVNDAIAKGLRGRGQTLIVDWTEPGSHPRSLGDDGIHLTELGEGWWASAVAAGIEEIVMQTAD